MSGLSVDPATLAGDLERVRAARERLDRIEAWLQEGVALFGSDVVAEIAPPEREEPLPPQASDPDDAQPIPAAPPPDREPPPATPPAAASRPPRPRSKVDIGRERQAKIMHAILSANPSARLAMGDLARLAGLTTAQADRPVSALVKAGKLVAEGIPPHRRYSRGPQEFHTERRRQVEATVQKRRAIETDAVARVGLRDRVMKAIAADPDCLTEDRLALALEAHRDDVAEACGWLLERDRVTLNPDGTYRRNATQAEAA